MQLDFGKSPSSAGSGLPHAKNKWKHLAQLWLLRSSQVPVCGASAIRILKTMGEVGQIPLAHVSSLPRRGHTHHLLVLLQQWTG